MISIVFQNKKNKWYQVQAHIDAIKFPTTSSFYMDTLRHISCVDDVKDVDKYVTLSAFLKGNQVSVDSTLVDYRVTSLKKKYNIQKIFVKWRN